MLKQDASVTVHARAFKMSKSRGNVVSPDDVVLSYGADSLRLYEMFMGPLRDTKVWSTRSVEGVHRFLARVWRLFENGVLPTRCVVISQSCVMLCFSAVRGECWSCMFFGSQDSVHAVWACSTTVRLQR